MFARVAKIIRSQGLMSLLLRIPFRLRMLNLTQIGRLAERIGSTATVDGIKVRMDSPLLNDMAKGLLVLGRYEEPERKLAAKFLPRGEPVIELGASIGVVACAVNKLLLPPSRHIAVEANPALLPVLEANRRINRCTFEIVGAAIAYSSGETTFYTNDDSLGGSLHRRATSAVQVAATSLQDLATAAGFDHFNLVSDIEGSEVELFDRESAYLCDHVGWIIAETHPDISGLQAMQSALQKLEESGFVLVEIMSSTYVFKNAAYSQ